MDARNFNFSDDLPPGPCHWRFEYTMQDGTHVWEYGCLTAALYPGQPPTVCPECGREVCREVKE